MPRARRGLFAVCIVLALTVVANGCGDSPANEVLTQRNARGVKATMLAFTRSIHTTDIHATCKEMGPYVTKRFMDLLNGYGGCEAVFGRLHGPNLFPTAAQIASGHVRVKGSKATFSFKGADGDLAKGTMTYGSDHHWRLEPVG